MQTKSPETLHKTLPGVVLAQRVRCGKPSCRCAQGELHGPYHYRFWREDGRLRKAYVRRADVEEVRAQCEVRRKRRQDLKEGWHQWRALRAAVRGMEGA